MNTSTPASGTVIGFSLLGGIVMILVLFMLTKWAPAGKVIAFILFALILLFVLVNYQAVIGAFFTKQP